MIMWFIQLILMLSKTFKYLVHNLHPQLILRVVASFIA